MPVLASVQVAQYLHVKGHDEFALTALHRGVAGVSLANLQSQISVGSTPWW